MKKILFVVESLSGGGAEKVLTTLIKNLDKNKYDITVFTVVKTGVYVNQIHQYCKLKYGLNDYNDYHFLGKIYYRIKLKLIYKINPKIVYNWLIKDKYDTEIAFVEGFDTKLVAASSNNKSNKIAWIHIDMVKRDYADYYYKSYREHVNVYKKYNSIICVSNDVRSQFEKKFKIYDNIRILYNPIDDRVFNYKKEYTIFENNITFCTVGRLEHQKGYDILINAFSKLKNKNTFKLNIIGEGSQRKKLEMMIKKYDLQNNIKLYGFLSNPYEIMSESDVFICSSRSEGFSLVIAEAMILGIPIITTNCAGPFELVEGGKYGILCDNSLQDIVNKLQYVLDNKEILYEYHKKSLKRSQIFDLKNTINKIERVLDE